MRKLLIMDHNSVNCDKQLPFIRISEKYDISLTIVAPESWPDDYSDAPMMTRPHPSLSGELVPVPVVLARNLPLHFYRANLAKLLRAHRPDGIFIYHDYYMLAAYQMFVANRASIRAPVCAYASQNVAKSYPFPFSRMERHLLRNTQHLLYLNKEAEEIARSKGFDGESQYMPLFVDTDLFYPQQSRTRLRERLGLAHDTFVVGYAGRYVEEKGIDVLLDAIARPGAGRMHVALIGKGPHESEIIAHAIRNGVADRVHLLPPMGQAELAAHFGGFDVLAVPSRTRPHWKEQFGRVIIEALACGTPVVGSASGAIPEVIESTGGGLVVPEGDDEALAAALVALQDDPERRRHLAETGRARARELYSLDAYVDRIGRFFDRMIPPHRPATGQRPVPGQMRMDPSSV